MFFKVENHKVFHLTSLGRNCTEKQDLVALTLVLFYSVN